MSDMSSLVRSLLFPAPEPPRYDASSFKGELVWIPLAGDEGDSSGTGPLGDDADRKRAGCVPCLFMPTKGARKMVVYFHGNGCDLGSLHDELGRYRDFWKVHLLAVEYPGYGACVGAPSEESINCVASAVFRYVTRTLRWPPMFVYLYGRSIGTGPVCKLAADLISQGTRLGGVVLQCAYTSIKAVVAHAVGSVAAALISNRWVNAEQVTRIDCPVLFIHGQRDKLIPFTHSEDLYESCKSRHKQLVLITQATHNLFDEMEDIKKPIGKFLRRAGALMQKALAPLAAAHRASREVKTVDGDIRQSQIRENSINRSKKREKRLVQSLAGGSKPPEANFRSPKQPSTQQPSTQQPTQTATSAREQPVGRIRGQPVAQSTTDLTPTLSRYARLAGVVRTAESTDEKKQVGVNALSRAAQPRRPKGPAAKVFRRRLRPAHVRPILQQGFSIAEVEWAMTLCRNDVDRALRHLLRVRQSLRRGTGAAGGGPSNPIRDFVQKNLVQGVGRAETR